MTKESSQVAKGMLAAVLIVVLTAFIGYSIHADAATPKPSQADINNLEDIKANQKHLELIRLWNQSEVDALAKNGWSVQWSKNSDDLKLIPFIQ